MERTLTTALCGRYDTHSNPTTLEQQTATNLPTIPIQNRVNAIRKMVQPVD